MKPLTQFEVKQLIFYWYKKLDENAPLDELLEMLASDEIYMKFPETEIKSQENFSDWYEEVTNKYFDETHVLNLTDIVINGDEADVKIIVEWQARTWTPPDAYSKFEAVYALQTWKVKRDSKTNKAVITSYIVDSFEEVEECFKRH